MKKSDDEITLTEARRTASRLIVGDVLAVIVSMVQRVQEDFTIRGIELLSPAISSDPSK